MGLSKNGKMIAVAMHGMMLNSLVESEKKKPQVIIVGDVSKANSAIIHYLEKLKEKNEVIIVANEEELKEKTGHTVSDFKVVSARDFNPDTYKDLFGPEPIKITNPRYEDFLPEALPTLKDLRENNPWPSPKGHKNKPFSKPKHTKRIWNRKNGY